MSTFATITGKITDPTGKPIPGILTYADERNTGRFENDYKYHALSDANGAISFPNLPPGSYKVRQFKPSLDALGLVQVTPDCSQWPMKAVDVNVTAGQSAVATFVNKAAGVPPTNVQPLSSIRGINIGQNPPKDALGFHGMIGTGCNSVRLWQYGGFKQPWPAALLGQMKTYHQNGVGIFLTINFQNAVPRCKVGPIGDLVNYVAALPDASAIGSIIIGLGNEINLTGYFDDSDQNYLAALAAVSPIARGKGHKMALGSEIMNLTRTTRLLAAGAAKYVDYIDLHDYDNSADKCLVGYDKAIALAKQYNLIAVSSELGMHRDFSDHAALAVEVKALKTGAIARGLPFWYFPLYTTNTQAGGECLVNQDGSLTAAGEAFKEVA